MFLKCLKTHRYEFGERIICRRVDSPPFNFLMLKEGDWYKFIRFDDAYSHHIWVITEYDDNARVYPTIYFDMESISEWRDIQINKLLNE